MRYIGIQHRVKRTTEGEARPTMVSIREGDFIEEIKLETEQDEFDFLLDHLPTAWRVIEDGEDISHIPQRHIHLRKSKKPDETVKYIPTTYEGLHTGAVVGREAGGAG